MTLQATLQVVVASNHSIIREGLVRLLAGQAALDARWAPLEGEPAAAAADVVLCAIEARPDADAVVSQLRTAYPEAKVLVLLLASDPHVAISALKAGAAGVIDETFGATDLADSISQVREGKFVISAALAARLAQEYATGRETARNVHAEAELTNREMEVLRLLAEGCTNRDIANRLSLSEHTVRAHLRGVMQKLQVSNRVQAAALAWQGRATIKDMRVGGVAHGNPRR